MWSLCLTPKAQVSYTCHHLPKTMHFSWHQSKPNADSSKNRNIDLYNKNCQQNIAGSTIFVLRLQSLVIGNQKLLGKWKAQHSRKVTSNVLWNLNRKKKKSGFWQIFYTLSSKLVSANSLNMFGHWILSVIAWSLQKGLSMSNCYFLKIIQWSPSYS